MINALTCKHFRTNGFQLPAKDAKLLARCFLGPLIASRCAPSLTSVEKFFKAHPGYAEELFYMVSPFQDFHQWSSAMDEAYAQLDFVIGIPDISYIIMDFLCGGQRGLSYKPPSNLFSVDKVLHALVRMSSRAFLSERFRSLHDIPFATFERLLKQAPGSNDAVAEYLRGFTVYSQRIPSEFLLRYKDTYLACWIQNNDSGAPGMDLDVIRKDLVTHVTRRRKVPLCDLQDLERLISDQKDSSTLSVVRNKIKRVITSKKRKRTSPPDNTEEQVCKKHAPDTTQDPSH